MKSRFIILCVCWDCRRLRVVNKRIFFSGLSLIKQISEKFQAKRLIGTQNTMPILIVLPSLSLSLWQFYEHSRVKKRRDCVKTALDGSRSWLQISMLQSYDVHASWAAHCAATETHWVQFIVLKRSEIKWKVLGWGAQFHTFLLGSIKGKFLQRRPSDRILRWMVQIRNPSYDRDMNCLLMLVRFRSNK